jgi:hypothetical protein
MSILEVGVANATSIMLSQFNSVLGIVSLTVTIAFTGFKFYQEIKQSKK